MTLPKWQTSIDIRMPPVASNRMYRHSATMHSHSTPVRPQTKLWVIIAKQRKKKWMHCSNRWWGKWGWRMEERTHKGRRNSEDEKMKWGRRVQPLTTISLRFLHTSHTSWDTIAKVRPVCVILQNTSGWKCNLWADLDHSMYITQVRWLKQQTEGISLKIPLLDYAYAVLLKKWEPFHQPFVKRADLLNWIYRCKVGAMIIMYV